MSENEQALLHQDPVKTARVALSVFFNIVSAWDVRPNEQMVLLGNPAESTFYDWKKERVANLSTETLDRISYILRIYKTLAFCFLHENKLMHGHKSPIKISIMSLL